MIIMIGQIKLENLNFQLQKIKTKDVQNSQKTKN